MGLNKKLNGEVYDEESGFYFCTLTKEEYGEEDLGKTLKELNLTPT